MNIPLHPNSNDKDYLVAFEEKVVPAIDSFQPEFVLISAGFDAHKDDPLSNMQLSSKAYYHFTKLIRTKERIYQGRIISILEGGYNLQTLGESVYYHLKALIE
jgi:acetoin utilization deacetylase AcuC-like enzyme